MRNRIFGSARHFFRGGTRLGQGLVGVSAIGAGGAAVIAGSAWYNSAQADRRINVDLDTYPKMAKFREELKLRFQDENKGNRPACLYFNALLENVAANHIEEVRIFLGKLQDPEVIITPEIRDYLIAYATNHSKIAVLELFAQTFGEDIVARNHQAKKLLALTHEQKQILTHYCEEFYQSPGQIQHDGTVMYVAVKQDELLEQHIQYRAYLAVFQMDIDLDMAEMKKQTESELAIAEELKAKFKRTIVIDQFNWPEDERAFEQFMQDLKKEAHATGLPAVGTFMLTGGHWTIGQVKASYDINGVDRGHIVFIDPKGSCPAILSSDYGRLASLPHHVFTEVDTYISEEKLQHAALGCSLFVLDMYPTMVEFDQIMAMNPQYQFTGNDNIFEYAERAKTSSCEYGVDFDPDKEIYSSRANFNLWYLPAALTIAKQSLECSGELSYQHDHVEQRGDGVYVSVSENKRSVFLGVMGINHSRLYSPPDRQLEFLRPADVSGTQTVNEVVDAGVADTMCASYGYVKPVNLRNGVHSAYNMGLFLSKHADKVVDPSYAPTRKNQ
jgi:hypothetical protein